jgi:hypothetical protein
MLPGGSAGDSGVKNWSSWAPTTDGQAGAQQIAEHVGVQYKLPNGRQIVNVGVTGLEIQGVPLAVAVRKDASQGGAIKIFDDPGVIYHLCGLGQSCAIDSGKPSTERGLLLRREALELALYTFRYLGGVHQVLVFMPPPKGKTPTQALFFREGDVARELDRPLTASLSPRVPTRRQRDVLAGHAARDQITSPKTFDFSLTGDQTSQRGFIVLDPPTGPDRGGSGSSSSGSAPGRPSSSGSSAARRGVDDDDRRWPQRRRLSRPPARPGARAAARAPRRARARAAASTTSAPSPKNVSRSTWRAATTTSQSSRREAVGDARTAPPSGARSRQPRPR